MRCRKEGYHWGLSFSIVFYSDYYGMREWESAAVNEDLVFGEIVVNHSLIHTVTKLPYLSDQWG